MHKDYWKEMRRLNVIVQQENVKRMNRITDHKRKRVWYAHSVLNEKNIQQRNNSIKHQCFVRTQMVSEQQKRDENHNFLSKLMKADPEKKEQREYLGDAIKSLNKKLSLGLDLSNPIKNRIKGLWSTKAKTTRNLFA